MMDMRIITGAFPPDMLTQLADDERGLVDQVAARSDTASLLVTDGAGRLVGYAVIGFDASDMVTVYAARSLNHMLARAAMTGIFGAAQIIGRPLRVHTERLRVLARMLGATQALACLDGDGLPMGVFSDGV